VDKKATQRSAKSFVVGGDRRRVGHSLCGGGGWDALGEQITTVE